ncbi:hypothetical protein V9T40_012279 [Parthenolecanium corni]|uniref:Mannosyltransferase n=1 Tax=Parthenolecanium corni TaxID=536013 RepID=A0AAN9TAT3_9HEMI
MAPAKNTRRRTSKSSNIESKIPKVKKNVELSRLKTDAGLPVKEELAIFYPPPLVAFKAIFCLRIVSAIWLHITDCDETFNYWEPSHYLLFGNGFQTWEYTPQYALRSYSYLLVHTVPAWIYNSLFHPSRLLLFYFIRCSLAVVSAVAEVYFYKSVCREFGINVGRIMLVILIFSPGMFIASTAYLPSSFSMYMTFISMTAWFYRKYHLAIFSTALSTFISWPFAALIGFPIACDMLLVQKKWRTFFKWSTISAVIILLPLTETDSSYYGRFTIAPWNIVKYNIFTSRGPNLYGTEPWYFYVLNGVLNFNFAFLLALATPFLLVLVKLVLPKKPRNPDCLSLILSLGSFYLWFATFSIQPHKEERFLFPIYPMVALCGAVSIDSLQVLWYRFFIKKGLHYAKCTAKAALFILVVYSALGISRMLALYKAYHAPMDTYIELTKVNANFAAKSEINLCVGREWHRFPSSFFLPDRWKLRFIKSDFDGLLPAYYLPDSNATKIARDDMNDANEEEKSRYVSIDSCDFLIDLDSDSPSLLEPRYSEHKNWTSIYSVPFLNAKKTPSWVRSFYVPLMWESQSNFLSYHLLQHKLEVLKDNYWFDAAQHNY